MPIAFNESTGEALRLDDSGAWVKTTIAQNPQTGEKLAFDGKAWAPIAGKSPPADQKPVPQAEKSSYSDGFMASVNPLGLGDEVGAAGSTVGQWIGNKINPDKMPFPGWGAAYDANVANERAKIAKFRDENPVAGYGGAIIGSMGAAGNPASTIGPSALGNTVSGIPVIGPKLAGFLNAPTAATVGGRMAQTGKMGAGIGGVYGFNEGEGGIADRAGSAVGGALMGGAIGAGAVPVIEGGVAGAQKLYSALAEKFGSSEAPGVRKIMEAMRRDRITPEEAAAKLRDNPNAALMDAAGENTTALAAAAGTVPGPSKQVAQKFIEDRMGGRGQRMVGAVDKNLAPSGELYSTIEELSAQRAKDAAPLYEAAYSSGPVHSDRIAGMLKDPIMQNGLKQGLEIQRLNALAEGKAFNPVDYAITGFEAGDPIIGGVPNMKTLDAVKKGLDNIIDGYRDGVTGRVNLDQRGAAIDNVRRQFLKEIDAINPDYAAARSAWAGPSADIAAAKRGRSFVNKDEEVTAKMLASMSDSEKDAFRIGAARALKDMIASNTNGAAQKFADSRGLLWDRMRAIFPDKAEFSAFKQAMENELKMQQNERFVSSRAGSPTTIKNLAVEDMQNDPGAIIQGGRQLVGGDKLGGVMNIGRGVWDYLKRPSERVANDLADRMFTTDPTKNAETLKLMQEKFRKLLVADAAKRRLAEYATRGGVVGQKD